MSSTPKKSTEAEDVLEFLNSLPDSDKKAEHAKVAAGADSSDIMDFLDELEATDKKKVKSKSVESQDVKTEKKEKKEDEQKEEVEAPVDATEENEEQDEEEEIDNLPDPVAAISSWWSSSGSATVSSLWGSAQQLSQKAQEEATKLSHKAQEEATKLKIDEQIKKLQGLQLDEETKRRIISAGDDMDPSKALGFFTKSINSVFSSIMSTDEILKISVTHDLENYYIEDLISKSFKKVMRQVQGGIAIELVTNTAKDHNRRNLNIFEGKAIDGEKLALANLETSINDSKNLTNDDEKDVRSSNLFISILPIQPYAKDLESEDGTITIDTSSSSSFHFLVVLKDTTNDITITTKSQAFPLKWATWLDGSEDVENDEEDEGVDPSAWVKGWVYDGLSLSFGVLAQSYVVKRMGYD